MNKKEALTQLEIMATNATGRLGEAKSEEEKTLLNKHIEALNMGIRAINWRNLDNETLILPSGELLVDTQYANEAKSVRLMDREGFTRSFEERKTGHWIMHIDDLFPADSTQECSECHEWQFICLGNDDNYCPNCGAKMEGENDEDRAD